jgi:transcriptional regulator with XRE-family HTH domain
MSRDLSAEAAIKAFYADFGQRLRQARGNTSQQQLGTRVGLSRGSISNIEAGRQHIPLHLLPRLARAVGVAPADLIAPDEIGHDVDVTGLAPDEARFVATVAARLRTPPVDGSS